MTRNMREADDLAAILDRELKKGGRVTAMKFSSEATAPCRSSRSPHCRLASSGCLLWSHWRISSPKSGRIEFSSNPPAPDTLGGSLSWLEMSARRGIARSDFVD